MSHANTTTDENVTAPIELACPGCGSVEHLHAVELVEVLVQATFTVDNSQPHYGEGSELLSDTQHWPTPRGAIVCRNCDLVDLRYGDLVPAISLTPTPGVTP